MPSKKRKRLTLRKKAKNAQNQDGSEGEDEEQKYVIDFIDAHRLVHSDKDGDRIEFKVRWKGYGPDDSTWEEFEMFAYDAPDVV